MTDVRNLLLGGCGCDCDCDCDDRAGAELVAAAQLIVATGSPAGLLFASNRGFESASRSTPGIYVLTLDHHLDSNEIVASVALNGTAGGQISCAPIGAGRVDQLQVTCLNSSGVAADSSFYISVMRVRRRR